MNILFSSRGSLEFVYRGRISQADGVKHHALVVFVRVGIQVDRLSLACACLDHQTVAIFVVLQQEFPEGRCVAHYERRRWRYPGGGT